MKTFNGSNIEMIRRDMNEALAAVAARHDIKIDVGGMRYSSTTVSIKVEAVALGNSGADSHEEAAFTANAYRVRGISAAYFGKSFRSQGEVFTINALKPANHKYPVIAKNSRGQSYKFPVSMIHSLVTL